MTTSGAYNLFKFAPRELSHTAFWAWTIAAASPHARGHHKRIARLGELVLEAFGFDDDVERVEVEKPVSDLTPQWNGTSNGRFDILVCGKSGKRLAIEGKVLSKVRAQQLVDYHPRRSRDKLAVISTHYAFDRNHIALDDHHRFVTFLDRRATWALLEKAKVSHPLVREYKMWLRKELGSTDRWRRRKDISRDDLLWRDGHPLSRVQWGAMEGLFAAVRSDGWMYNGTSKGSPYTQFALRRPENLQRLFYRLDKKKAGPYLGLRVWAHEATQNEDDWRALQNLWAAAADSLGISAGRLQKPYQRKTRERTITEYLLDEDGQLRWRQIVAAVQKIHPHFVRMCRKQRLLSRPISR